ncbi:MAG TPA: TRAP transporter fused permease subunit [Hyphomicrobiaceae bacterium]|nr:TRAP transporter fused permease subunit [Hyphomicrobiaceae bacterium]
MLAITRHLGAGLSRELGTLERAIVVAIGVAVVGGMLAVVLGFEVDRQRVMCAVLGLMMVVAFLTTNGSPSRPRRGSAAGCALALGSAIVAGYFTALSPTHQLRLPMVTPLSALESGAAVVLLLLILEATRRTMGMSLLVVIAGFLAYAVFGHLIEGSFSHRRLTGEEILDQLVFTPNGVFGSAMAVATFLVLIFVAFGSILERFGGGDFFFDLSAALVGRQPGGPAKVAIISSGLYGTISGSPTADVVTTGAFTIPLMIRVGYSRVYAAAIEAVASTGGAILPPVMGTAAFLMSDVTGISYGEIAKASIIGALLYYFALFVATDAMARRGNIGAFPSERIQAVGAVLRRDWVFFIPIAILIWFVFNGDRPTYGAGWAIIAMAPIALMRSANPRALLVALGGALSDSVRRAAPVVVACAVAGIVVGSLSITDLSGKFSSMLFGFAPGDLIYVLVIAALVTLILGMGMPTPAVYVLAAVLLAPAIINLGVSKLAAHLFIVYYASMSAITPPVAVAAFAAASIAEDNPIRIGLASCRLALIGFILPFLFVYRPALLMQGSALEIASVVLATFAGVTALAAGWQGYFYGRLEAARSAVMALGGVALVWPGWRINALGAAPVALVIVGQILLRRPGPIGDGGRHA